MAIFLKKRLLGYAKIIIEGRGTERFLNIVSKRDISIWNIEKCENKTSFFIYTCNIAKINEIADKADCCIQVDKKHGLSEFFRRHKAKSFFVFGIFLFTLSLYALSLFVWDIRVYVKNKSDANSIMKICAENGLKKGTLKSNADLRNIEAILKREIKDLSWIRIEFNGTYADIKTAQAIPPNDEISHTPCDIIASEDAIILSVTAAEGTPLARAGDVVKKGDLLISANVKGIENEIVITEKNVHARGKVTAKFWKEEKERINYVHTVKEYTGKKKEVYSLNIFGSIIGTDIFDKNIGFSNYETKSKTDKIHLWHNFVIPIELKKTEYKEYTLKEEKYNKKEALHKGEVIVKSRILASYEKNNIKDIKIFYTEDKDGLTISAAAVIEGNIGVEKPLQHLHDE